jgi:arylsulfatase A-like enzyme
MAPALATVARAQQGPARRDRPNILFIFTDQQQRTAMSAAGNPAVRTPAMDSVAQAGVLFSRSFCSTPQCSASRASILTGRYPHSAGVITNTEAIGARPLDPRIPSAGQVFRAAGYETAYFGKWHLGKMLSEHGFDKVDRRESGEGEALAARAVEFIREKHDRPFFMMVSFVNPHDIYNFRQIEKEIAPARRKIVLPASRKDDLRTKPAPQAVYRDEDQGVAAKGFGDDEWRRYLEVYYYLVEKVDGEIGRILDALRALKLDRETIVVFTSDHGDLGGAHGLCFKGPCMYRELVEVPLAMCGPGVVGAGRVCDELVSNVDYLPTLCDLAGIAPPEGVQGMSLRPHLENRRPPQWREFVVAEYYSKQRWANPVRMLQTKRWKYVRYRRWGEELYDLERDPDEMNNLAHELPESGEIRQTRDRLAESLDRWMRETGDNFNNLEPTTRDGQSRDGSGSVASPKKNKSRSKKLPMNADSRR